ncbi:MAG: type IV pilus secretin PilQ [Gammaproteobacteria bacterium]|nr:type IV pilus secretin PilQ [Gammaproteobacteria bacterium]
MMRALILVCCLLAFQTRSWSEADEAPISLRFQSIELRAALQILAEYGGANLIVGDSVGGELTLELEQMPWREAFDAILLSQGLVVREQSGTLIVMSASQSPTQGFETRVFALRFAEALALKDLLRIEGEAKCLVDERTNRLIVTDTRQALEEHARRIAELDVPVAQVLIEARVVIVTATGSEQLGVTWLGSAERSVNGGTLHTGSRRAESEDSEPVPLVDLAATAVGVSRFGLGFANNNARLDVEISALETSGEAEIIARPRVVAADRQTAIVRSGVQIPYQESTSSGATSTSFQSATLSLEVTPRIAAQEKVMLALKVNQDTVGQSYGGIPSINTNAIETEVLVNAGETLVLGGVYQNDVNKIVSRVPVLGSVPLVGRLFRRTISSDDRRELLVFLTPKVLP